MPAGNESASLPWRVKTFTFSLVSTLVSKYHSAMCCNCECRAISSQGMDFKIHGILAEAAQSPASQ